MKDRKKSYFKKVGDSLPKIVNKNISERSFVELSLIKNWNKIIGKEIACYCWPIKMVFSNIKNTNGIIFLKTKRGKSMEIEFKHNEIIEKLNQYFGYNAVSKISIIQDFDSNKENNQKKTIKIKDKAIDQSKFIDKINVDRLKNALKKLNKTLLK
mgnify:CR=1 FL=1|tara:strand:- start:9673 stop:10137 length:465 start_codon:yes stop_codon:yes gene_type:complete